MVLDWRIKAYKKWIKMKEPKWSTLKYPNIDFNEICCYSSPKKKSLKSLDEVDPELLKTYDKLGIPLDEQKRLPTHISLGGCNTDIPFCVLGI